MKKMKNQPNKTEAVLPIHSRYQIGDVVRHRMFPFRGIVFDIDPQFSGTEEWLASIPAEIRPERDQPFYHLLAENEPNEETYVAYVSEQNLVRDHSGKPVNHPAVKDLFSDTRDGVYVFDQDRFH